MNIQGAAVGLLLLGLGLQAQEIKPGAEGTPHPPGEKGQRVAAWAAEPPEGGSNYVASDTDRKPDQLPSLEGMLKNMITSATPTAFETRDTGRKLEAAIQPVGSDPHLWDLSIAFEEVRLLAMEPQGAEELGIKQPAFSTFKTGGLLRVTEAAWHFLSVQDPPPGLSGERTGKSWLSLVRVDRNG